MTDKKPTKAQLAKALNISRSTLHTWEIAGAPVDKGEEAITEWAMANTRKAEPDTIQAAKLEVLRETARRLKLANDEKSGRTINKEEVIGAIKKAVSLQAQVMDKKFRVDAPPALTGLDAKAIESWLLKAVDEFNAEFARQIVKLT